MGPQGLRRDAAEYDQHTARKLAQALKRRGKVQGGVSEYRPSGG